MKIVLYIAIGFLSMASICAQNITDAVRFSNDNIEGSARFRALSGAFGALGGNLSAVSLNPASSAVFSKSTFSVSISNLDIDNTTSFFGNTNSTSRNSSFDLNQTGASFVFNNRNEESSWKKVSLSVTYDQTQNFDDSFFASGVNTRSIDSYFLANAEGLRLGDISILDGETFADAYRAIGEDSGFRNQQALLGVSSSILQPTEDLPDNTIYTSNIAPGTFNQDFTSISSGNIGKLTFNAATQYKNSIYLGVNLNSHFIDYSETTLFFENNSNNESLIREVGFENNLSTIGNGFSFQLGGIAKLGNVIRVGFTYDSPTWYSIREETVQSLSTLRDGFNESDIFDPQIINVFPSYRLQTPGKIAASLALIFGKQGLISFDYSRKDFGNTRLSPSSDFPDQNNNISNNLTDASTYRIGGEYRYNNWSYRGGYRLEESPYEDTDFFGDLNGYSLGLGYDFGRTKLDFAYDNFNRDVNNQLFNIGLTDTARVESDNSRLTLTLSFNL